jgi:hypothetical protein
VGATAWLCAQPCQPPHRAGKAATKFLREGQKKRLCIHAPDEAEKIMTNVGHRHPKIALHVITIGLIIFVIFITHVPGKT